MWWMCLALTVIICSHNKWENDGVLNQRFLVTREVKFRLEAYSNLDRFRVRTSEKWNFLLSLFSQDLMLKKLEGSQTVADNANSFFLPWVKSQIPERLGCISSGSE